MTRLRLSLADSLHADRDTIKGIAGVMGVIESDNQFQIVLGPGKAQTACELMNGMLSAGLGALEAPAAGPPPSLATSPRPTSRHSSRNRAVRPTAFWPSLPPFLAPLIPGFIAAGLLLGFATLIEQTLLQDGAATGGMLVELVGYMKLFLSKDCSASSAFSSATTPRKRSAAPGVNGAILASLFVMGYDPQATSGIYSGITDFFGHHIDPRGNIIGVLIACIIGASVERQVRRFMPDSLDMILTSCITLLIMGAVTFVLIMPLGVQLYNGMSWLFIHLNGNPFGTAILAGLFLISVMFGIHQGFVPVYFCTDGCPGLQLPVPHPRAGRGRPGRRRPGALQSRSQGLPAAHPGQGHHHPRPARGR